MLMNPTKTANEISKIKLKKFGSKKKKSGFSRVLLVCDEMGYGMSQCISESLTNQFSVSSVIRTGGNFAYVTKDIDRLANNFTKNDYVILMIGARHTHENTSRYLKAGFRRLINKCASTNILFATIPFDFDDYSLNDTIYQINQFIEGNVFKTKNRFCVYTNKVLLKEDYKKNRCLNQSGKKKFAKYIAEYITGQRSDDRACEITARVTIAHDHVVPSEFGSTSSPVPISIKKNNLSIKESSKNKRQTRKSKLKTILKKLLTLLE